METPSFELASSGKKPKTAILLFGLLREFEVTAPSFMQHVADPLDADIFYAGPAATDRPMLSHKGKKDLFGGMKSNPKGLIDQLVPVDTDAMKRAYGARLRATRFHNEDSARFSAEADARVKKSDWLFKLNPARMFSMFYNIEAVVELFMEYEKTAGVTYDHIILTRPDLAFYGPLICRLRDGEFHIAQGEGFDGYGHKHTGSAPVLYYRNVERGWYVPPGHVQFNDQIFYMKRPTLDLFRGIYAALGEYMSLRVPASPETVFYLHLVARAGLRNIGHPEWLYEIRRAGMPLLESIVDTNEIMLVDRTHPAALKLRKQRPISSMLRDIKHLYRRVKHRILR